MSGSSQRISLAPLDVIPEYPTSEYPFDKKETNITSSTSELGSNKNVLVPGIYKSNSRSKNSIISPNPSKSIFFNKKTKKGK